MSKNNASGVITYKNPKRNKQKTYTPYVPQYQIHGKEPGQYPMTTTQVRAPSDDQNNIMVAAKNNTIVIGRPDPLPLDNPRSKRPAFQQPIQRQPTTAPQQVANKIIPNIGNNIEQVWSSIDGQIEDDLDPNQPFIDNNDFVSDQAMGFQSGIMAQDLPNQYQSQPFTIEAPESQSNAELFQILNDLDIDNYLLIVSGVPICSGPQEQIEEQARLFAFGQHETCDNAPVPLEDILIFKKAKIKVGLFLE